MAKGNRGGKRSENDIYSYKNAYQSYKEKAYRLSGSTRNEDGELVAGNKMWTGKKYTNDEFMEHLEDGNWHSLYKAIIDNKLTNKQVAEIKDNMKLGLWSFGDYKKMNASKFKSTKEYVEAIIKDAKNSVDLKRENEIRTNAKKLASDISMREGISYTEAMKKAIKQAEKM